MFMNLLIRFTNYFKELTVMVTAKNAIATQRIGYPNLLLRHWNELILRCAKSVRFGESYIYTKRYKDFYERMNRLETEAVRGGK